MSRLEQIEKLAKELQEQNKALRAEARKAKPDPAAEKVYKENLGLRADLRLLKRQLEPLQQEHDRLEELKAAVADAQAPDWALEIPKAGRGLPGVPTVLGADWHTGETVRPALVYGKNRYNQKVQEERVQRFITGTIDLLTNHVVNPSYPGIVLPLAGDMVSGGIHEELEITNWADPRDSVRLCTGYLIKTVEAFAERFGHVYVPCVTGNHGRLTKRMQYKRRAGTSLDAMIYDGLAARFAGDRRITIHVAEGTSIRYRVFGHRYLLLHGDPGSIGQHGGDGIIGALGPIIRGKKKLLARNAQIGLDFDTLVLGHWHTALFLQGAIVGASMKGFDEMCVGEGYEYEPPTQSLWLTHPERGLTIAAKVHLEPKAPRAAAAPWCSFERPAA
jgi:hypothetical protein